MFLLCYLLITALLADNKQRFHATPPFFRGPSDGLEGWEYGGMSIVSDRWIQLTPNIKSTTGSLWAKEPSQLTDWEANFQLSVSFLSFIPLLQYLCFS